MNVTDIIMQSIMRRKLGLFGHICRMDNSRKIKSVLIGMMEETRRKGRPYTGSGQKTSKTGARPMYSASQIAQDRGAWTNMVTSAMDTIK